MLLPIFGAIPHLSKLLVVHAIVVLCRLSSRFCRPYVVVLPMVLCIACFAGAHHWSSSINQLSTTLAIMTICPWSSVCLVRSSAVVHCLSRFVPCWSVLPRRIASLLRHSPGRYPARTLAERQCHLSAWRLLAFVRACVSPLSPWEGGAAQLMWHLPWRLKTLVANVLVTLWQSKKPWSSKSLMSPDVFESARSSRFTARFAREYDAIPILCDPSTCYRCCSQSMTASPDPRAMIRRTYPTLRRIPHTAYSTHGVRMYQCCLL